LEPNEFRVVRFADSTDYALWVPPADGSDTLPIPVIEKLKPEDKSMAEAHYELILERAHH